MAERHANNFTFLRFLAASMVIVAHAYDLQNVPGLEDPLARVIGRTMGWTGVGIFFVMSGYLIMMSLDRTRSLVQFARARALRIYPGLIACTLLTIALFGLFVTTLPAASFFSAPGTIKYLFGNGTLLAIQHYLPGVFESNPYPRAVNGSLWTLPYEVSCYIMAAGLTAVGVMRIGRMRAISFAVLFALVVLFILVQPYLAALPGIGRITLFHRLAACFLLGMAYASFGDRISLRWWHAAIAGLATWLLAGTAFYELMLCVTMAVLVFKLAFAPNAILRRLSELPDYSYGIYIYAFPIQQTLIMLAPGLSPAVHALIAFLLVLIPASLSWHFVEKPALRFKKARQPSRAEAVAAE